MVKSPERRGRPSSSLSGDVAVVKRKRRVGEILLEDIFKEGVIVDKNGVV